MTSLTIWRPLGAHEEVTLAGEATTAGIVRAIRIEALEFPPVVQLLRRIRVWPADIPLKGEPITVSCLSKIRSRAIPVMARFVTASLRCRLTESQRSRRAFLPRYWDGFGWANACIAKPVVSMPPSFSEYRDSP